MKKITKTFILTLAHLLICTSLMAQAPQKMSYQAVIRDASQVLVVNQSVGIQISILQGSAFGTAVYVETQQPTSNMNGLVNIEIGNGNVILGNFSTIDWANGSYFIKTETDPTGGTNYTITGTNQLLSVPYALYAENAGSSIPGPQGPAGADGTNGIDGINGVDGVDGINGTNGVDGTNGTNGIDGINGVDGTNGVDGISITWLGSLAAAPSSPSLNDGYYNTTLLQSFIWDGATWNIIAKDGTNGIDGVDGTDGALNAWSLNGNAGTILGTNFIGTTDAQEFALKANNQYRLFLKKDNSWQNTIVQFAGGGDVQINGVNVGRGYGNWDGNTIVGTGSLASNTSGLRNTAIGYQTLNSNTTGEQNTATGHQALKNNTSGSLNTATGYQALLYNTTGNFNTAIGIQSLYFNTTGSENTTCGEEALIRNTTGSRNTCVGMFAGNLITIGSNNVAIGHNAQVPSPTSDNQVRIGNTSITYAGVQVAWSITSDKRWKTNIMPSNLGLDFIKKLNPVFYTRTNDKNNKTEYGFIAQELEATLNNSGAKNNGIIIIDDEGMYSVRYNDLIAPMVKAMQEQQKMIEQQLVLIENMQKEIDNLKNIK